MFYCLINNVLCLLSVLNARLDLITLIQTLSYFTPGRCLLKCLNELSIVFYIFGQRQLMSKMFKWLVDL